MKRLAHPLMLAAGTAASLSFVLTGCGAGAKSGSKITFVENPESRVATQYQGIQTFAQSLAAVNLDVDPETHALSLSFSELDPSDPNEQGEPAIITHSGFTGFVKVGQAVELSGGGADYDATVTCADSACSTARIDLEKSAGARSGSATIRQTTYSKTRVRVGTGRKIALGKNPRELVRAIGLYPHRVNFAVSEIENGSTAFVIQFEFSNRGRTNAFVEKRALLQGWTGRSQTLTSSITTLHDGGYSSGGTETHMADVKYDSDNRVLYVDFKKDEGLNAITVGPGA